jgi:hypothetical protein
LNQKHQVRLYNLTFAGGVLIKVECKAWAKNIDHGGEEKVGIVKFELWVD